MAGCCCSCSRAALELKPLSRRPLVLVSVVISTSEHTPSVLNPDADGVCSGVRPLLSGDQTWDPLFCPEREQLVTRLHTQVQLLTCATIQLLFSVFNGLCLKVEELEKKLTDQTEEVERLRSQLVRSARSCLLSASQTRAQPLRVPSWPAGGDRPGEAAGASAGGEPASEDGADVMQDPRWCCRELQPLRPQPGL